MNKFQTTEIKRIKIAADIIGEVDGDARTFTAKITTSSVDRDGEVLIPQGMDAKDFSNNGTVFWNHDYQTLPLGRSLSMKRGDGFWEAKAWLVDRPPTLPAGQEWLPDTIHHLMLRKVIKGVSVGFIPIESRPPSKGDIAKYGDEVRRVYSKWKLLEFSVVPLPANQDALITAVSKGVSRAVIKSVLGVDVPEPAPAEPRRVVYFCPTVKRHDPERIIRKAVAETLARIKGRPYV